MARLVYEKWLGTSARDLAEVIGNVVKMCVDGGDICELIPAAKIPAALIG